MRGGAFDHFGLVADFAGFSGVDGLVFAEIEAGFVALD